MTTYKNPGSLSGHSPFGISMPQSYIDAQILYDKLSSSITAKQIALEIWLNQAAFRQAADAEQGRKRTEFTFLAEQYELDLTVEALTVVIQHSAMRDYCNIPLHLPVSDHALQRIANTEGQEFDTVSYVKTRKDEDTYIPNIVGFYVPEKIAVMASVGVFAKLSDDNLQKLKRRMMAAALSLPDCFARNKQVEPLETVHLVLIDFQIETGIPGKHIGSLKDIDQFICVTGAGEAIQEIKALLKDHVRELINRVADKAGVAEQVKPLKGQAQLSNSTKVRIAFLKPHPQGLG